MKIITYRVYYINQKVIKKKYYKQKPKFYQNQCRFQLTISTKFPNEISII